MKNKTLEELEDLKELLEALILQSEKMKKEFSINKDYINGKIDAFNILKTYVNDRITDLDYIL